jgi:capsid portal protein
MINTENEDYNTGAVKVEFESLAEVISAYNMFVGLKEPKGASIAKEMARSPYYNGIIESLKKVIDQNRHQQRFDL